MKFNTRTVHAGIRPDPTTGAIVPPIFATATYVKGGVDDIPEFDYTRATNPNRKMLENSLAALEGGKYGICFASGMAAIDSCIRLLRPGDHVICSDDVYGGVSRLLTQIWSHFEISSTFVDTTNVYAVDKAIGEHPNTKLLWIETPSNPLLKITDVQQMYLVASAYDILLAVDSTFATPCFLRPLEIGADIVVQSTTKYISGHNQVIGGAILTNSQKIFEDLKFIQKSAGAVSSPFDCWLTISGIKTLALRMQRHTENAQSIAEYLEKHSKVSRVIYPGLKSHPNYSIAKQQMSGASGMISFELKGGIPAAKKFMSSLKLWSLAESLGSVESMVTHPATMTHASVLPEVRLARGLTDGLVRLSVGIEDIGDLTQDLESALSTA